ncbi:hypothetical protein [Marinoscillum sp.]|uniref:hypothetical protein n=1 Tax=Marinoscillum sp. TaxID=2024838 RepID=UPI003BACA73C
MDYQPDHSDRLRELQIAQRIHRRLSERAIEENTAEALSRLNTINSTINQLKSQLTVH